MLIAACLKWVARRPEIDALTGVAHDDERFAGASDADQAALEWALRLAEAWGGEVLAVTAGPAGSEPVLRDAIAVGASRAVRVDLPAGTPSEAVAAALAPVLAGATVVCCGDYSFDRGSGSVPAYLAAHLSAAQALGLVELTPGAAGTVEAVRRLDGGRRERLRVGAPAVVSVEGSTARLRRAPLAAALRARAAPVDVLPGPPIPDHPHGARRVSPYRPRARALPGPTGEHALDLIVQLTEALHDRTPPAALVLDPPEAAERILETLRAWGELER